MFDPQTTIFVLYLVYADLYLNISMFIFYLQGEQLCWIHKLQIFCVIFGLCLYILYVCSSHITQVFHTVLVGKCVCIYIYFIQKTNLRLLLMCH